MKNSWTLILLSVLLLFSCADNIKLEKEIAQVPVELSLTRFEVVFDQANPSDLPALKQEYPQFFPSQYPDSLWLAMMEDSLQLELRSAVIEQFPADGELEMELENFYKHLLYYFPDFDLPEVFSITTDVDYKNPMVLTDNMLIVGLDNYLGEEHPFYQNIPRYVAQNLRPERLTPDLGQLYAQRVTPPPSDRTLLGQMIYHGKLLYVKSLLLPQVAEETLIGYRTDQLEWAQENEIEIWRYFIEREMLYQTDPKLGARFISPAPFSKFYLEIDNESPGMIGRYIGWQMVKAYQEKNDNPLADLLSADYKTLYEQSKYKPSK